MTKEIEISQKLYSDIRSIIERGRKAAYTAVNKSIILTNWHVGHRIVMEEQQGQKRAQYGSRLIKGLAEKLVPVLAMRTVREILTITDAFTCHSATWRL